MKIKIVAFSMATFGLAILGITQQSASALVDTTRDCDKYAIIRCGALTQSELKAEYDSSNGSPRNTDTTVQSDIQKVFTHMGIARDQMNGLVAGTVYRDGTVKINGKTVATDAVMAARNLGGTHIAGTDAEKISVNAMGSAQAAMVKMVDDTFQFAVMTPCGNPVTATPVPKPKPPTPKQPGVAVEKYVNTNQKYQRVGVNVEYSYLIKVINTGEVALTNVQVNDTPDQGITLLRVSPVAGTINNNTWAYTIPTLAVGQTISYTLTAKVPAYLAGKLVNTVCVDSPQVPGNPDDCDSAEVDVPPAPGKIQVCELATNKIITITETEFDSTKHSKDLNDCKVPELPHTGPAEVIMQIVGAMSLVGAGAYYITSRKLS